MADQTSSQTVPLNALLKLPSTPLVQTPVSRLERLPPELRNAIYSLCIVTSKTVIRSPMKKAYRWAHPFSTFWCLLLVNKNIHKEASSWYYTFSTFVFGLHSWGSTTAPNIHAMKAFVKRVGQNQLALITKVEVQIVARSRVRFIASLDKRKHVLGDKANAVDLRAISRTLLKYFHCLESIKLIIDYSGPLLEFFHDSARLSNKQTLELLQKFLLELLKIKSLTSLRAFTCKDIPMQEAAKIVLEGNPEISKILEIYEAEPVFGGRF